MRTKKTWKKYNIFKIIVIICINTFVLTLSTASANPPFLLAKYGYGKLHWGEKQVHSGPEVYPLEESYSYQLLLEQKYITSLSDFYPYYYVSDSENKSNMLTHKINIKLSVQQDKANVVAKVVFINMSDQDYYVFGDKLPGSPSFSEMCGSSFLITTDNIKLDYLGRRCEFGAERIEYIKSNRQIIKAGKTYSFTANINRVYDFLPGKHEYTIGSLDYSLATKGWFQEQRIYYYMFSILDYKSRCPIETDRPKIEEFYKLCKQPSWEDASFSIALMHLGFFEGTSRHEFYIRSNETTVTINATEDTSKFPYPNR